MHVDHASAVKKSDHQKFVGGFALSGLLGLGEPAWVHWELCLLVTRS